MNQKQTPLADALSANSQEQFIPFDVPGHKGNIIDSIKSLDAKEWAVHKV